MKPVTLALLAPVMVQASMWSTLSSGATSVFHLFDKHSEAGKEGKNISVKDLFKTINKGGSGEISQAEFAAAMQEGVGPALGLAMQASTSAMFAKMDVDGSAGISPEEFGLFFDPDNSGHVSHAEFDEALHRHVDRSHGTPADLHIPMMQHGFKLAAASKAAELDTLSLALADEKAKAAQLQADKEAALRKHTEEVAKLQTEKEAVARKHAEQVAKLQTEKEAVARKHAEQVAKLQAEKETAARKHTEQVAKLQTEKEAVARKHTEQTAQFKAEKETAARKHTEQVAALETQRSALAKKLAAKKHDIADLADEASGLKKKLNAEHNYAAAEHEHASAEHQSAEAKEATIKNLEGQLFIAWVVAAALCVLGLAAGLNLQRLCKPRAKAAAAPVAAYAKAASPKAAAKVEEVEEEEEEEEEEEVVVETEVIIPTKKKGRAASGNPKKNK